MYLLSLVILFGLLGYIFATSRWAQKVDATMDRVASPFRSLSRPLVGAWKSVFPSREVRNEFRDWALGVGARLLPADLKAWLAGLSEEEARQFHSSLAEYADSLGFDLSELVDGSLDQDPRMRQVFVEAIVVYSPAYRKARQAREKTETGKNSSSPADSETRSAEKAASRRKGDNNGGPVAENGESAAAA